MYIQKNAVKGYNSYIDSKKDDCGTMMDVGLLILDAGESFVFPGTESEALFLLFCGKVRFKSNGIERDCSRKNEFEEDGWCLHVCAGTEVTITALAHSELYVQKTINERSFESRLYAPSDVIVQHAGNKGELMGCMRREIKTFFHYDNAPYSNMVLGEVLNFPGKWSSYPPHHHPQPEVYFHRFDKPQGFGVSFAGGEIFKSAHNGLTVITSGFHSQGAAPGYAMCYVWGIRHLDGDPWKKTRIDDKEHAWLWESDANDHIFKERQ